MEDAGNFTCDYAGQERTVVCNCSTLELFLLNSQMDDVKMTEVEKKERLHCLSKLRYPYRTGLKLTTGHNNNNTHKH